jgi:hypothetical protein
LPVNCEKSPKAPDAGPAHVGAAVVGGRAEQLRDHVLKLGAVGLLVEDALEAGIQKIAKGSRNGGRRHVVSP